MFPEHVERRFLDPEYSFAEYFQLGSRRNIRPIKKVINSPVEVLLYVYRNRIIRDEAQDVHLDLHTAPEV